MKGCASRAISTGIPGEGEATRQEALSGATTSVANEGVQGTRQARISPDPRVGHSTSVIAAGVTTALKKDSRDQAKVPGTERPHYDHQPAATPANRAAPRAAAWSSVDRTTGKRKA